MGWIMTMPWSLGALIAGSIGNWLGWYKFPSWIGFVAAIVVAFILVSIYSKIRTKLKMTKQLLLERVRNWLVGCLAYTSPLWQDILRQRSIMFFAISETISLMKPQGVILDIGTGWGTLPLLVASVARNITCIGIDLRKTMLEGAQKTCERQNIISRVSFIQANVESLPFTDESFDIIISFASLHQWKRREKGITEIYRVLKTGGIALIWVDVNLIKIFDWFRRNPLKSRDMEFIFKNFGFQDVLTGFIPKRHIGDWHPFSNKNRHNEKSPLLLIYAKK